MDTKKDQTKNEPNTSDSNASNSNASNNSGTDLSNKWQDMNQDELYIRTVEPNPVDAVENANNDKFHKCSAAYTWNNEPASKLTDLVRSLEGKKAFGVLASGDQPFIFFNQGLKSYLGFDISQVACFWNELKTAAIIHLSMEEFISFTLNKNGDKTPTKKEDTQKKRLTIYDGLKSHLTSYAREFFDTVIKKYDDDRNCISKLLNDGHYFRGDTFHFKSDEVPYLKSSDDYKKLQKNLQEGRYKFMWRDLSKATEMTPSERFDIIFISNILDRWHLYGGNHEDIVRRMRDRLALTPEAMIIGNYQWSSGVDEKITPIAQKLDMRFTPHCEESPDYWKLTHAL